MFVYITSSSNKEKRLVWGTISLRVKPGSSEWYEALRTIRSSIPCRVAMSQTGKYCDACGAEWPSNRWSWAFPGIEFHDGDVSPCRTVTFCKFQCKDPLYCPTVGDVRRWMRLCGCPQTEITEHTKDMEVWLLRLRACPLKTCWSLVLDILSKVM